MPNPFKYVLTSVNEQPPAPEPEPPSSRTTKYEEGLLWHRQRTLIEYPGYMSSGKDEASDERKEEVAGYFCAEGYAET